MNTFLISSMCVWEGAEGGQLAQCSKMKKKKKKENNKGYHIK